MKLTLANHLCRFTLLLTGLGMAMAVPTASAQDDDENGFSVSAFADFYYGYDFNDPASKRRPDFLFNHTKNDEPELNLGLLTLSARGDRVRANLGLMNGTYATQNLAAEPSWAEYVFEANVGFALNAERSVWLDVGIIPSHIGFESAISTQNATLSRSISAENSPYFLTGANLNWAINEQWSVAGLMVTGWQRTKPVDGNSLPSFGTQVVYRPSETVSFNWSTFIGTDDPDETRRMRYFNNFYVQYAATQRVDLTVGFDIGAQQKFKGSGSYDLWWTPTAIVSYQLTDQWAVAMRMEYFRDVNEVLVNSVTGRGIGVWGVSWNIDWRASDNVMLRLETRWLNNREPVFEREDGTLNDDSGSLLASVAFEF
ncbi:MAG: porin [Gammaproteobacteria bacterium]|nr:porin [Gammaproteobacteria bacterium]